MDSKIDSKIERAELSAKIVKEKFDKISMITRTEGYLAFICKQLVIIEDRLNNIM